MPQGEHSTLQGSLVTAINGIAKPQKLAYAFPELRCTLLTNSSSLVYLALTAQPKKL
jgi:Uma2 family endonuclease